jgi:thiosulfate reductase cytochrome b subunit
LGRNRWRRLAVSFRSSAALHAWWTFRLGRYRHFLAAWVCVLTGLLYTISGLFTQHFRNNLVPKKSDLALQPMLRVASNHLHLKRPSEEESQTYNVLQRISYITVVFLLFPFVIVSGFAMSPAMVSVFPVFVTVFGGHQTARTLHFFAANLLLLFLLVHIAMVILAGFTRRMRAMLAGLKHVGDGRGSAQPGYGYSWFAGI